MSDPRPSDDHSEASPLPDTGATVDALSRRQAVGAILTGIAAAGVATAVSGEAAAADPKAAGAAAPPAAHAAPAATAPPPQAAKQNPLTQYPKPPSRRSSSRGPASPAR